MIYLVALKCIHLFHWRIKIVCVCVRFSRDHAKKSVQSFGVIYLLLFVILLPNQLREISTVKYGMEFIEA